MNQTAFDIDKTSDLLSTNNQIDGDTNELLEYMMQTKKDDIHDQFADGKLDMSAYLQKCDEIQDRKKNTGKRQKKPNTKLELGALNNLFNFNKNKPTTLRANRSSADDTLKENVKG